MFFGKIWKFDTGFHKTMKKILLKIVEAEGDNNFQKIFEMTSFFVIFLELTIAAAFYRFYCMHIELIF